MYTAVANSELSFKPYLTVSGILHAALILVLALSAYFHWQGNRWAGPGGGNESTKVTLVGNSGLPMPKTPSVNESNVVDPSKSLWKNDVKPEPQRVERLVVKSGGRVFFLRTDESLIRNLRLPPAKTKPLNRRSPIHRTPFPAAI